MSAQDHLNPQQFEKHTGKDIVGLWTAGQCRWANYSNGQLNDALHHAASHDKNAAFKAVARALNARGALDDRQKRDLGHLL